MSHTHSRRLFLILFVALLVALLPLVVPRGNAYADQPDGLERVALEQVAARTGRSTAQLRIVQSSTASYPLQGRTASAFKVEDIQSGESYGVLLDSNGQPLDAEQLAAAERDAYHARYGRFEPALAERMATAGRNDTIPVLIWLKDSDHQLPQRPLPGDALLADKLSVENLIADVRAQRSTVVQQMTAPVLSRLEAMGVRATANSHVPVVYGTLSTDALQRIATWQEVDRIYLDSVNQSDMGVSRVATGAIILENFVNVTGAGERVAQIEVGGRVATNNPFLSGITQDTTYVCNSAGAHSTGVAGVIRSTDATQRGIAPGVTLWAGGSCGGVTSELQNRSSAAAVWGATAMNLSWGSNTNLVVGPNERFYDDYVFNSWFTVVKSAGNFGEFNGNITSPGLAYNILTVGNYDHHDTNGWADDTMDPQSSFNDPISTHGDREKPDIAAPGHGIMSTTTSSPWIGNIGSGTSFAAPQVTGGAALLMQVDNALRVWPEGVRAIMMVGAFNNIEGSARLSERDGAGGIDLLPAYLMAKGASNADWGGYYYSCGGNNLVNMAAINLTAGIRTRIAIAWPTSDDYVDYVNRPDADLDLRIIGPGNVWTAGSASYDNTYEIVDFTPTVSGTYTIQANKFRCNHNTERWIGYAWYQGETNVE